MDFSGANTVQSYWGPDDLLLYCDFVVSDSSSASSRIVISFPVLPNYKVSNILWGTNDLLPSHYLLGNDSSHTLSGGGSTSLTMGTVATSPSAGFLSPPDSLIVTSPALSTSSLSSLDIVIVREQLDSERPFAATVPPPGIPISIEHAGADSSDFSFSDEDDEIIWRVSDSSDLEESHGAALSDSDDDDDFVVLRRTRSPGLEPEPLVKAEIAATSIRTIRGIPPNIPFGPDSILEDVGMDEQDWPTETPGVAPSEFETGSGVGSKPLNETGETKSPVNRVTAPPAKKRKPKKKRTPEEVAKKKERKERKERKKREKKAAQALKELQKGDNEVVKKAGKGNDSGRRKVRDTNATPATTKTVLQPTTIVPSSSTVTSPQHIPPSAAISNKEAHRIPGGAVTGSTAPSKKKQRKGKDVSPPLLATGSLMCNPVVAEKVSEQVSGYNLTPESYDRAVSYITSYVDSFARYPTSKWLTPSYLFHPRYLASRQHT